MFLGRKNKKTQQKNRIEELEQEVTRLNAMLEQVNAELTEGNRRELAKAIEKTEESERSKSNLLVNISREIRTPMNSIIGFSELLNIGKLDFDKRKYYVKTIRNQATLILKFIDDITELIRFESGKVKLVKSRCNLNLLLKEIMMFADKNKNDLNKDYLEIRLELPDKTGLSISTDPGTASAGDGKPDQQFNKIY